MTQRSVGGECVLVRCCAARSPDAGVIAPAASWADLRLADGIEEPAAGARDDHAVAAESTPIRTARLLNNAAGPDRDPSEPTGPTEPAYATVVSEDEGQRPYAVDAVLLAQDGLGSGISDASGGDELAAVTVLVGASSEGHWVARGPRGMVRPGRKRPPALPRARPR